MVSPEVRPLWPGIKFWGVAFTIRCVPANQPMWRLNTTEDVVNAHSLWFKKVPHISLQGRVEPGHVMVTDAGSA